MHVNQLIAIGAALITVTAALPGRLKIQRPHRYSMLT